MSDNFVLKSCFDFVPLQGAFIDNYFKNTNPAFIVIYIYALREASKRKKCGYGYLADCLGMLESDIKRAFDYWQDKGLIRINDSEIEFLFIAEQQDNDIDEDCAENLPDEKKETPIKSDIFPDYTNDDVDKLINSGEEFEQLKKIAEGFYGRPMQSNERNLFLAMYYSAGLPLDVIAVLCAYCSENNKKNIRYIESIVNDWYERGIDTSDKAEEYISTFKNIYRPVMRSFGVTNREATKNEMKKIDKWLSEYKSPLELILAACQRTIDNTGKISFSYADKILEKWSKAGIRTLAAVKKSDSEFENKSKENKVENKKKEIKVVKATQFSNFEQRNYDPEKLKELQDQLLNKYLDDFGSDE